MNPIGLAGELGYQRLVEGKPTGLIVPRGWVRAVLWDRLAASLRAAPANDEGVPWAA